MAAQVLDFLRGRLRALWSEEFDGDLVEAVLAAGFDDVVDARQRLEALAEVKPRARLRAARGGLQARRQHPGEGARAPGAAAWTAALLRRGRRAALLAELERVEAEVAALRRAPRLPGRPAGGGRRSKPAVDRFFDEVLVMAEDPARARQPARRS